MLASIFLDKTSSFEILLEQNKFVTMHTRNLQMLATDMFKVYRSISPPILHEIIYGLDIIYNLKINSEFPMPNVRSFFHGSKSISCLVPKTWNIVTLALKKLTSVDAFKKGIKKWKPKKRPCRLCGFIIFKV